MSYPKELLEPASPDHEVPNAPLISIAISLKRIADILEGSDSRGLMSQIASVLDDASHNHAQRMR